MPAVILKLSRTMIVWKTGSFLVCTMVMCNLVDRVILTKCKFPKVAWQHYVLQGGQINNCCVADCLSILCTRFNFFFQSVRVCRNYRKIKNVDIFILTGMVLDCHDVQVNQWAALVVSPKHRVRHWPQTTERPSQLLQKGQYWWCQVVRAMSTSGLVSLCMCISSS